MHRRFFMSKNDYFRQFFLQFEMKHIGVLFTALCLMLTAGVAVAQSNVSGVVKDRAGEPLIGANVNVKGTTISTITGVNGDFNISAADDAVLVISFEGYHDFEVRVADLATANIQLKPENLINTEPFYGNDNYYALTTASTLIVVDDIATGLETDIQDFLLGHVPGLEVVDGQYRLRGGNSLTGWDEIPPLFVVDGAYDFYTDAIIAPLNPADIETIRVLKDAAATAQYGMMAKGGAIVIKTRRPSDKVLTVTYDGNVSLNTPSGDDSKWETYNSSFENSASTKHNLSVAGIVEDLLPYRASLGYNAQNSIYDGVESDLCSASLWVGPRLFDKHLNIDANGAFRNLNATTASSDVDQQWLLGTFNADYAVHSFEVLHLNFKANVTTNFDGYKSSLIDGSACLEHQFGKKHYLEIRAGGTLNNIELDDKKSSGKSGYGQFNMAINRFFMNAHTRINAYSYDGADYSKLSMAVSFGVKPINILTIRSGLGVLGIGLGDQPEGISDFSTITYNLGVDVGTLKNRINGSADFYYHVNCESPAYIIDEDVYLNNVGAEYRINAKIVDNKDFKLHIGGTLSGNVGLDFEENGSNSNGDNIEAYVSIGGYTFNINGDGGAYKLVKSYTYGVYSPVYDKDGNCIPGMYVDYDGDGTLTSNDRISSGRSPVPSVMGGLNTYLEVKGAYLQLNAHTSLDRQNVVYNIDSSSEREGGQWLDSQYADIITADDIYNSSFLRIDNVVLGYRFSNLWKFSGRVYAAVQNPVVFAKYEGLEPEIYDGYDTSWSYLRRATTFTIGMKLNINIKD